MSKANIHDRTSIERLYDRETYENDARRNSTGNAAVLHGVRIMSAPDDKGDFDLVRGSRHAGEAPSEGNVPFLAPDLNGRPAPLVPSATDYGGPRETAQASESGSERGRDYGAFVDRIIETARTAAFQTPIGLHEERLRGFHGG
jgi:hypothetical protein